MRKVIFLFALLTSMSVFAQHIEVVRGGCTPESEADSQVAARRAARPFRLPAINKEWDAERTYKQLVILISFSDLDFTMDNPREFYDNMFNTPGFNQRKGPGCVAEYFKAQSNGLMNMQFDVVGPYKVSTKAQPYDKPDANTKNYGQNVMREATNLMIQENPEWDFTPYDWNGNGAVNQVIYIAAGYTGNVNAEICYGYIWPNTSSFSSITTHDNKKISSYTVSCEHWPTSSKTLCGLGTVCHEFTHSLGLPDIYPTSSSAGFSVCDEWDLMDGGNFSNYGWCPPNYTPLEKMLLGWTTPVELTEPTSIKDLAPSADGGNTYIIKHSDSEWLMLENRQQKGWDAAAPGKGLIIYHVNYDGSVWSGNTVNNNKSKYRFDIIHADNWDYSAWDNYIASAGISKYANSGYMNSKYLSTSPYPYVNDTETNDSLTDNSVPAATMFYPGYEGETLLKKPITNIKMDEDGLISFDFMGGEDTTVYIREIAEEQLKGNVAVYDLNGRLLPVANRDYRRGLYLERRADGTLRKVIR
jgi:M6 family metalloprotease-like protein